MTLQLYAIELELARKQYDAALRRLDSITAQSQRKETWHARRGEILLQAGRPVEARSAFAEALHAMESLPVRLRQSQAMLDLKARVQAAVASIENSKDGPAK